MNASNLLQRRAQQPQDDPLLQCEPAERVLRFVALGEDLRVETNDERVEVAARQSFGPVRDDRRGIPPAFTLRLLVHDVPEVPEWTPTQPVMRAQGAQFYVASSRASVISGDVETGTAFGFISTRQAGHEEHLRSALLQSAYLCMASRRALTPIHAACIRMNGTTLMLRGQADAGKTTQAYAALKVGFSLLSEDAAFAWNGETGLELRSLPNYMYLKPDAIAFFPELQELPIVERFNGEHKYALPLRERFPRQIIERAEPGPTIFVQRDSHAQYELVPLGRDDALKLYEATRIPTEYPEADGVRIWDEFLNSPAFRFLVGPDPLEAAKALVSFCQG